MLYRGVSCPVEPTVVHHASLEQPEISSQLHDVSRAGVGFIEGDRPEFSDETTTLLRSRLAACALAFAVILFAVFIESVVVGIREWWWFRILVFGWTAGSFLLLKSGHPASLQGLRWIELLLFGSVLAQLVLMMHERITYFLEQGDAVSMASVKESYLGSWCVLLFIYGILVPNTWRRAATVMLPVSLVPSAIVWFISIKSPLYAQLASLNQATYPIPLPLVAASVGIFGAHVIHAVRREAFKSRQFGQYRLQEKLGSGGMGDVYKAEHVLLKRPCAMKLIKSTNESDAASIERFEKEVKATSKLTHWNTIEIYDYGHTDDGTFYYVMELLPGMSLQEIVDRFGPLPPERAARLLHQVCGALQEAHSTGLIHRDVKPANIFAAQRGGVFDVAKLLDFGLVKEDAVVGVTNQRGSFSGTPLYMSPEQAVAYEHVDRRADVYSLGAVAYFLVTGQPPFSGESVAKLLISHATSEPMPPSQVAEDLPKDFEQVILRCLKKRPDDRFQSASELADAISNCDCADAWSDAEASKWWAALSKERGRTTEELAETQDAARSETAARGASEETITLSVRPDE